MENLQLRKEILVFKIKMKRNNIANLQILLNAYRTMKDIQFVHRGEILPNKSNLLEQKINQVINRINLSIETLSKLESELISLGED